MTKIMNIGEIQKPYEEGHILLSKTEINPAQLYGGSWEYLENTHLFQGWYIYEKVGTEND